MRSEPPIINMLLRKGDLTLSFFSAVTFIGRARDITLQELKIECFFPPTPRPISSPVVSHRRR